MSDLNIIHTTNKSIWEIDNSETLTYTVVIYNISEEILEDLEIQINIANGSEYVKNTFTLNGKYQDYNSNNSVYIKKLVPTENIVITYDIKINGLEYPREINSFTNVNYVKKKYSSGVSYDNGTWNNPKAYIEKISEDPKELSERSEVISTPVIYKNVFIYHEIDKQIIRLDDILEYKFIIKNDSNLCIDEAFIENISNSEIEFIQNSLYINGINIQNNNFKNGIYIGFVNPKETILIAFKAKVIKANSVNAVSNKGKLNFCYKNDCNYRQCTNTLESNEVILDLCANTTKSINLSKVINMPSCNAKANQIVDIFNYDVEITSKNIVKSMKNNSVEQNQSNGRNIFLTGVVKGRITYNSEDGIENRYENRYENRMYIIEYDIPFKADIPMSDDLSEYVKIVPTVEFVDANLLENNRIYINVILDIDLIDN